MDKEEKLDNFVSESCIYETDENVTFLDVQHLDCPEELTPKDVSNFVEIEASPIVIEQNCDKPMQLQAIADMISHLIQISGEDGISKTANRQSEVETENIEVNNSYESSLETVVMDNNQQILEIQSDMIEQPSVPSSELLISGRVFSKTSTPNLENILPNEKQNNNNNISCDIDKSNLPPDVIKVLKNILDNKVMSSDRKQKTKPKIIVAKLPTNALKQLIALKDDSSQLNKLENYSIQNNNCITKLPPKLGEALKNVIVQKASNQMKSDHTSQSKQFISDMPSSKLEESHEEKIKSGTQKSKSETTSHKDTINKTEKHQLLLCCPSKFSVSKYHHSWRPREHDFDYLPINSVFDFGEYILSSSKKCLLLTLPCSPGFEDERATHNQMIAEQSGTSSYFEFTESCMLEKEFNKIFHYFSCTNISSVTRRETVVQYIFQTIRELLTNFPVEDTLKIICNCSLCWYLYVRGKIISSYYPEENLKYSHSPLASYRTVVVRNIEITDLIPVSNTKYIHPEDHYFLPIRFKRGGKKRDLTKSTGLVDSFNPFLNGTHSRRSKEAEINMELSKYYTSRSSYINDCDYEEEEEDNNEDLRDLPFTESVTPVELTMDDKATRTCHNLSQISSGQDENFILNSKSGEYSSGSSKSACAWKSYSSDPRKLPEQAKKTIHSRTTVSQVLSVRNTSNPDDSSMLRSPVSSDLNDINLSETSSNTNPVYQVETADQLEIQNHLSNIQTDDIVSSTVTSYSLPPSGSSASKCSKQKSIKFQSPNSDVIGLNSSGLKRKLEKCESTSKKLKSQTSYTQEPGELQERCIDLPLISSHIDDKCILECPGLYSQASDKIQKQNTISDIQISKENLKTYTRVNLDPALSKVKKATKPKISVVCQPEKQHSKMSNKTSKSQGAPTSKGLTLVKLPNSSNLFDTLENFGISDSANIASVPSKLVPGLLKTLGVSKPPPTINFVKISRSSLSSSLQTLCAQRTKPAIVNFVNIGSNSNATQITKSEKALEAQEVHNPNSSRIKVIRITNSKTEIN